MYFRSIVPASFTFNTRTAEILKEKELIAITEDNVYINNIVKALQKLYRLKKTYYKYDLATDKIFLAICAYLKLLLQEICSRYKMDLKKLYPIFILPYELSREPYIIEQIMLPLLTSAGLRIPPNYSQRLEFTSHLEAAFASYQLPGRRGHLKPVLQYTRCTQFIIYMDNKTTKVITTNFQLIEDHRLIASSESYYSPHQIKYEDDSPTFGDIDLKSVKKSLQQFIVEILELKKLIANALLHKDDGGEAETLAEYITIALLSEVWVGK